MSTGWICPKCGRVYAPFVMECSHCNNNEIKQDPCLITLPWSQDYSKYKSEVITDTCKCDQNVTIDDERLKYTTSREFNSEYLTYTTTTTQDLKLDKEPVFLSSQMICDSQGSREVDLFGRPIVPTNGELKTLMSPEQLKELADREQMKVEYDNTGVTQSSEDCRYIEWQCPICRCQFYKFPYKGCFCGARIEEIVRII